MQSWDLIRAFLALHRCGSFEAAAQLLAVDHSTLRRRIQALEQSVGVPLFHRLDGRYGVAPGLEPLLDAALRMDASSRSFFEGAAATETGSLRVSMLDIFAGWLAPALAAFKRDHPQIILDLTTETYFVDLEREMVDVAIRLARPTRGDSRLLRLGEVRYGVYAAPAYLEARARHPPEEGHDLLALSVHFLHRDHEFLVGETAWMLDGLPPGRVITRTDSYTVLKRLCEAGLGLALLPDFLAAGSPGLVPVPCDRRSSSSSGVWAVVHRDTAQTARVRLFVEFLGRAFRRDLPAVDGAA